MKHFFSLIKRQGLHVVPGTSANEHLAHQVNHELMKNGYLLSKELFTVLSTVDEVILTEIMNDIIQGIEHITGKGGYQPTYQGFPQSVTAISYEEFAMNAILYYWTNQAWRPEETVGLEREFAFETTKFIELRSITEAQFNSIFTDLLTSNVSISQFDKSILEYFIVEGYSFQFSSIKYKEIIGFVGQLLLDSSNINQLPVKNATDVLRILAAYSGGDEGLKQNTKFKNPTNRQAKLLMRTLDGCYNLEDSFKTYREQWLRVLFYLHPLTPRNRKAYPNLGSYTDTLRNAPSLLKTFNSRIEEAIANADPSIFKLLSKAKGIFTRRLDHLIRVFGYEAFDQWIQLDHSAKNLITAYNHFTERDKATAGRGAVLAGQDQSQVVTYDSLEPLDTKIVTQIKEAIIVKLAILKTKGFNNKKVFIDSSLYYRPLDANNRASNLSLTGSVNGTVEKADVSKTLRMYVHWEGRDDIDLSAMIIDTKNNVVKIGWNGRHHQDHGVIYSGDNTGHNPKNAEYIDITPSKLTASTEWIICDAVIYRGKSTYAAYKGTVKAGWMLRSKPESNSHWLPQTVSKAQVLSSNSRVAYLMAYHVPTDSIVYLDLAMTTTNVTTEEDALKMRVFLNKFVQNTPTEEISWDRINQGHFLHLLSGEVVGNKEEADLCFESSATIEEVSKYMLITA